MEEAVLLHDTFLADGARRLNALQGGSRKRSDAGVTAHGSKTERLEDETETRGNTAMGAEGTIGRVAGDMKGWRTRAAEVKSVRCGNLQLARV